MTRRCTDLVVIVALSGLLIASCTASARPTPPAATPAPASPPVAPVKLVYWEDEADDGDVVLDALATEFTRIHPHITVERIHLSYEELLDRAAHDAAPDLVRCISECTGPLSASGRFQPAGTLFDAQFLADFLPGALEAATLQGVVWGIPDNYGDSLLLIYNRSLVTELPADTDAWIAQLGLLTRADEDRWGLAYHLAEPYWLIPWVGGFGGWIFDATGQPTLDSPAVVEALRFVWHLRHVAQVTPPQADYDMALDYFRQGRAAYLIDGDWSLERLRETGIPFGVRALPRVSATGLPPTPLATARHWFIARAGLAEPARRAAVTAFVAFMAGTQSQSRWLETAHRLPSSLAVAASPAIAADPLLAGTMEQLRWSRGLPAAPAMHCVWRAMRPGLEDVMADRLEAKVAAQTMQAEAMACIHQMADRP